MEALGGTQCQLTRAVQRVPGLGDLVFRGSGPAPLTCVVSVRRGRSRGLLESALRKLPLRLRLMCHKAGLYEQEVHRPLPWIANPPPEPTADSPSESPRASRCGSQLELPWSSCTTPHGAS